MRQQPAKERIRNFNEVPLGYSEDEARREASRCLQCKKPQCVKGCPVGIDIPGFIKLIAEGKFLESIKYMRKFNTLPATCGRVCPQETQCEELCVLGKKGEPVAIGRLERFVADYERTRPWPIKRAEFNGHKVAIVGSGPAGLTCAGELAKMGYEPHVFEALHRLGGVLVYGIPEFRLPKAIVQAEVGYLEAIGVRFHTNQVVGRTVMIEEFFERGFEAVFVGSGAGLPRLLGIPGENFSGVLSANEYLTRVNLMKAYRFPEYHTPVLTGDRVLVFGGGNVTMDCARTARRLGGREVTIAYRRGREEMPARVEEVEHAEEEGVRFELLVAPLEFLGDERGWIRGVRLQRMELGEPDESGRRRPVPIEGSEFTVEAEMGIIAIGNLPHPLIGATTPGLELGRKGNIVAGEAGATSVEGVFAGGDIVTGAATVIEAMGAGKQSAAAIADYIENSRGKHAEGKKPTDDTGGG